MGSAYDYIKRQAIRNAKRKFSNVNTSTTNVNPAYQIAKINQERTQATFADGTSQTISPAGIPNDYNIVMGGEAVQPAPNQYFLSGGSIKALVVGIMPDDSFYIRQLGDDVLYQIPTKGLPGGGLDPRILPSETQVKISPDGKAVLIGGSYQDIPYTGAQEGAPQPGYTYRTYCNWILFTGVRPSENEPSAGGTTTPSDYCKSFMLYSAATVGKLDVTSECDDKIPPPGQEEVGSASIYRLFASAGDLYLPSTNVVGPGVAYAYARFFPMVYNNYTTATRDAIVGTYPTVQTVYGIKANGEEYINWSADAKGNAMFRYEGQPVSITRANLLYVLSQIRTDGPNADLYTVDIVGDFTYSAIYKIDSIRATTYDEWNFTAPSVAAALCNTEQSCYSTQLLYFTCDYEWYDEYPYVYPFYNTRDDEYVVNGQIFFNTEQLVYTHGGTLTSCFYNGPTPTSQTEAGSTTATYTNFGNICTGSAGPFDCRYFYLTQNGDMENACGGGGITSSCGQCFRTPYTDTYNLRNFDGSGFNLVNVGIPGMGNFFIFRGDGGCVSPACPGAQYFATFSATYYYNFSIPTGYFSAYRYSRSNVSMEKVMVAPINGAGNTGSYLGPAIIAYRLSSPMNQNHMYGGFRGLGGGTALVYQCADPYIPPTSDVPFPATITVEEILAHPEVFDGINVFGNQYTYSAGEGYSAYFWCGPYYGTAIPVAPGAQLLQHPDVFTDRILAPTGTFPFAEEYLKAVDSFVVEGLSNRDGGLHITKYLIEETGLTAKSTVSVGFNYPGEILLDYIQTIVV
jgi:hypothetical protein